MAGQLRNGSAWDRDVRAQVKQSPRHLLKNAAIARTRFVVKPAHDQTDTRFQKHDVY